MLHEGEATKIEAGRWPEDQPEDQPDDQPDDQRRASVGRTSPR
jgi:hypothetical protein